MQDFAPDLGDLSESMGVSRMTEDLKGVSDSDWTFHQATGMVAVQIDAVDLAEAAAVLVDVAVSIGESVHDTALLVLDHRLRLVWGGASWQARRSERCHSAGDVCGCKATPPAGLGTDWLMVANRSFPADAGSVAEARRLVLDALEGLAEAVWDDGALLVSEVATNVVDHAGTDFEVRVLLKGRRARVEVSDGSLVAPTWRDPAVDADRGRGLVLLNRIASVWGVEERTGGKCVWFEIGGIGVG